MTDENKRRPNAGRKTKLTPEVQQRVVEALKAGNYACVAAEYAGITSATYYNWRVRGEEEGAGIYFDFLCATKEAEVSAEVRAVALIQNHMKENWAAAMTYLERKHPDRWGRRSQVRVTNDSEGPLRINVIALPGPRVEGDN